MTLDEIIEAAGGLVKLAQIANVDRSTVSNWRAGRRVIVPKHAIAISDALHIPRHEIRPDLWPPPEIA